MAAITTALRPVPERGSERVDFMVRTDQPVYQDRLAKMGWRPTGSPDEFARRLDSSPDIDEIFQRFSQHIEAMIRQSARLEPIDWERGLREFSDRASGASLGWWLYGSGALAVRGLPIEPGDLDFHVDDAFLAGRILADLLVEPVTRMHDWIAEAGGRAFVGVIVEWLAGAHPSGTDPPHEQEEGAARHLEVIRWKGREIPVPTLDLQLAVAEHRGLADRVAVIRSALGG